VPVINAMIPQVKIPNVLYDAFVIKEAVFASRQDYLAVSLTPQMTE